MAKQKGKQSRKERREQRRLEREAQVQANRQASGRRRILLAATLLATAGGAFAAYRVDGASSLLGIVLLVGCGLMLILALGGLGGAVKPRDRGKSGNIDFGR